MDPVADGAHILVIKLFFYPDLEDVIHKCLQYSTQVNWPLAMSLSLVTHLCNVYGFWPAIGCAAGINQMEESKQET